MSELGPSFEKLVVLHKENFRVIFFQLSDPNQFDYNFFKDLQSAIKNKDLNIAKNEGHISHGLLNKKYILIRTGKFTITLLVHNNNPNRFSQDAIQNFSIRMESRWKEELKELFTEKFKGDLSIFHQDSDTRLNLRKLAEEIFQLK